MIFWSIRFCWCFIRHQVSLIEIGVELICRNRSTKKLSDWATYEALVRPINIKGKCLVVTWGFETFGTVPIFDEVVSKYACALKITFASLILSILFFNFQNLWNPKHPLRVLKGWVGPKPTHGPIKQWSNSALTDCSSLTSHRSFTYFSNKQS